MNYRALTFLCALFLFSGGVSALDYKNYYPGTPGDEEKFVLSPLLEAKNYSPINGITFHSDADGLRVSQSLLLGSGYDLNCKVRVPIKGGKLLKVTTKFFFEKSIPGGYVTFYISLFSAAGKNLGNHRVGASPSIASENMKWCEEYVSLPPEAKEASFIIQCAGNPFELHLPVLELETVPRRDPAPVFSHPAYFSRKMFSDAELTAALEKKTLPRAEVKTNGDLVEFRLDGKAIPLKIFKFPGMTYNNGIGDFSRKIPAMMNAGFNIFIVPVYLGVPGHFRTANSVWLGENHYQINVIQQVMRRVLRYAPDAKILLELNITPPPMWGENHPDEVAAYSDGRKLVFAGTRCFELSNKPPENYKPDKKAPWTTPYWIPSYYSKKFTADASKAVYDIFRALEQTPEANALVGVFLDRGTDGQWFCLIPEGDSGVHSMADYSPASLKYFQDFLREKYHSDVNKLRAEWGDVSADFDKVAIPNIKEFFGESNAVLRKTGRDRLNDFIESRAKGMSEQFIAICRAVKQATNNRLIVGGYRAEGAITPWPFLVQQCSRYMYEAKEVDFFASCPGGRCPENPVTPALANGSLRLHGKLGITELDFRSPTVKHWGSWGDAIWYKTHPVTEFAQRTMRAQLWASAYGGAFHAYDMDGGWYDAPEIIDAWKENNRIYSRREARPLSGDRAAIFFSERYWEHMALNSNRALAHTVKNLTRLAFTRSGIDSDLYVLSDVFHPGFQAPQILCFADAFELTEESAALIRNKFANSGRVLIWMWAPGIGTTRDISRIANFKLTPAPEADGRRVAVKTNADDPLLKNVKGILIPEFQPWKLAPVWRVNDPDATVLGTYLGTNIPAFAVKRYANHTEIFIGQFGSLSPSLIRNIAREGGAHIYLETDDPVALAGNLLLISCASSGEKTISLKEGMTVKQSLTKHNFVQKGNKVSVPMKYGDVCVLELE